MTIKPAQPRIAPLDTENPYLPPTALQVPEPRYSPWRRVIIALLCTAGSGFGLVLSVGLVLAGPALLISGDALNGLMNMLALSVLTAYAWTAYFWMTWGWIRNRSVSPSWPRYGTVAALICLVLSVFGIVAVLPAVGLAIYLVRFHLGHPDNKVRAQW